jgi:hypothetical protein
MPSIPPKRLATLERKERELEVYRRAGTHLARYQAANVTPRYQAGEPWARGWVACSFAWYQAILSASDELGDEARASEL